MSDETGSSLLNIAAWEERSVVNGPGERFVLWVQGCPFRCPGCFNPDFLPFREAKPMSVREIAERILRVSGIEGVSFSGGEPMAQAHSLYELSLQLKAAGLTIVSFSGYRLEELQALRNPWVHRLLGCLDILIDGRFEEALPSNRPWRGSSNQVVHLLTDRYRSWEHHIETAPREVEFVVGKGRFVSTGIFDEAFMKRLDEVLREGLD